MKIIIGLGNPGEKYKNTRHNVGFEFADKLREVWNFPNFEMNNKFNSEISSGKLPLLNKERAGGEVDEGENKKIILVKPQTFMNLSGEAVQKMLEFYKLTPDDIIVIHDDLDIELGKYRIATDSSSAGHNGVQDIIEKLGTQKFQRIRVGIKTPESEIIPAESYVLQKFKEEEKEKVDGLFDEIKKEVEK